MSAIKGSIPWNKGQGKGWTDKRGYRWLYVTENGRQRARREHRVIMEQHLGRRLEPWELVHHINEDISDNRLENLQIMEWGAHTTRHHNNARHDADARRTMEAFALMRQELAHLRRINADLLAACHAALDYIEDENPGAAAGDAFVAGICDRLRGAAAKARGEVTP